MFTEAGSTLSFLVTPETAQLLQELDAFIEDKIKPLQASNDNERVWRLLSAPKRKLTDLS